MIPPEDETNRHLRDCLEESERQYQAKVTEVHGLRDANEALRRDNDDLTRQAERARKQRDAAIADYNALNEEAETLRQRVASLEHDAATANAKELWQRMGIVDAPSQTSERKQNVDDQASLPRLIMDSGARQQAQIDTLIRVLGRVVR